MPTHTDAKFAAACHSLVKSRIVREALQNEFGDKTKEVIRFLKNQEPLPSELMGAYDVIVDFFNNEAPVVKEFEAEQDKGVYSVQIRGMSGAYFVWAPEYGDSEVFLSKKEAEDYVQLNFGEFIKE